MTSSPPASWDLVCARMHPHLGEVCPQGLSVGQLLQAIVAACKNAWDFLINDPDRIASIGTRAWLRIQYLRPLVLLAMDRTFRPDRSDPGEIGANQRSPALLL